MFTFKQFLGESKLHSLDPKVRKEARRRLAKKKASAAQDALLAMTPWGNKDKKKNA